MNWRQQEENEQQRRETSMYCVYCGKEANDRHCCGEAGHVECYEDHLQNWNTPTEILNADPEYAMWVASTYLTPTGHHHA